MALAHSPRIITDGLVLCLDVANPKSYPGTGTTWTDLSSQNDIGTLTNNPVFDSTNGGSLTFNGTNTYITTTKNVFFGTGTFTISAWVKRNGANANLSGIICTDALSSNFNWQLEFTSAGSIRFECGAAGFIISGLTAPDLTWVNVVIVRENTGTDGVKGYLNGVLIDTGTSADDLTYAQALRIGRNRGGTVYMTGSIANISIYKGKALTQDEVIQNFNALRGRFGI